MRIKTLSIIILVVVAVSAGAVYWHKVLQHEYIPRNFGVVEDGSIFRSGQLSERMLKDVVQKHNLRTIIALNGGGPESEMEQAVADELNIARREYELPGDGTGDPKTYAEVISIMTDPEMQPVLIHCAAGAQRTSTTVLFYRHLIQGKPIADAYPESFDYKHKPDEWELLAFVADHVDEVRKELDRIRVVRKTE